MLAQVLKKQSGLGFDSKIIGPSNDSTPNNRRASVQIQHYHQDQDASGFNTARPMKLNSMYSKKGLEQRIGNIRYQSSKYQQNKESSASFFSRMTFAWTIEILKIGKSSYKQKKNLQAQDLFDCIAEETPEYSFEFMQKSFIDNISIASDKYLQQKVDYVKKVAQSKHDKTFNQANHLKAEKEQANEKKKLDNMLYETIKEMNSKEYVLATVLSILGNLCQFVGPILLNYIIKFLKSPEQEEWLGYMYASLIFVGYFLRVFMLQHSLHLTNRVGIKVLNALNTSIYNKILKLSSSSKKYYDSGKTMNLVTVDSQSIFGYVMMAQNMITAPIMVVVSVAFIIYELGIIGIATPFFFIIGAYLQKHVNARAFKLRRIILSWTDKRSKQLNEFFENIRVIKFYGWEDMISKRILDIRATETSNLLKNQVIKTVVEVIMNSTPIVISLFIFGLYAGLYGDLEPAKAYTVISLLNLLLNPLKMIVIVLLLQQNATTSSARISEFLMAEEQEVNVDRQDYDNLDVGEVFVQNASFSWDSLKSAVHNNFSKFNRRQEPTRNQPTGKPDTKQVSAFASPMKLDPNNKNKVIPLQQIQLEQQKLFQLSGIEQICTRDLRVLKNITLKVEQGDVVAIVGQVASGKSSLLLAILGEMINTSGSIKINGSVAYVPQSAWLQNATLRDNITFGLPYDDEKYQRIIDKCQLKADLNNKEVFPFGDMTEIGERGVNLSGGQRQRIGIARAVYADSDIYLIDDCLSALDAQVGKLIFYEILMGELEGKTIIFVTHALHFIEDVKKIVVLKEGEIVSQGTHENLKKHCLEYQKLTLVDNNDGVAQDEDDDESDEDYDSDMSGDSGSESDRSDLSEEEQQQQHSKNMSLSESASVDIQQERVSLQRRERRVRDQVQDTSEHIQDFGFADQRMRGITIHEERKSIISRRRSRQLSRQSSKSSFTPNHKQLKSRFSSLRRSETKRKLTLNLSHLDEQKKFEESGVPYSVYKRYITSGGRCATFNMLMSFFLAQGFKIISDWWIGQWSSDSYDETNAFYIILFFVFGAMQALFIYLRGYTFGLFTINSSNTFQKELVIKLLHTPQWWYDVTPIGKIISRTTKDQDDMDSTLPWNMKFALTNIFQLITVTITIGIIFPHFIALGVICFYFYSVIIQFYLITAREIKKIEASTRAPVISHFQETTNGIIVIRAFQRQRNFMQKMLSKQRDYIVSFINQNQCNRWVSVVTDLMGLFIVAVCAYFSVLSRSFNIISDVSLIGLALSSSFQISQIISFTLKLLADTESNMNSLVRILSLIDKNPQESSWDDQKAPPNWPCNGEITFENVSLKYRPELPQIVNNLSVRFDKQQKIGVVGRTGCGKSTLTLGILRILEITFDQHNEIGKIILDGQDIREIGLHELRQKVTIIPQDPILFSGTVRSNIDPFNQYSDQIIVEMLKKVNIWEGLDKILEKQQDKRREPTTIVRQKTTKIMNMNVSEIKEDHLNKLNLIVETGGSNFSLGQRQLICIARALIKKPKVLLMDEATASIDEMTDAVIQNLIKQELKNATVITIAHRLKTIIQYDKILVLDKGNMKEFDTPINLLNKEQSFFRNLVTENGLIFLEEMKQLALKKEQESNMTKSREDINGNGVVALAANGGSQQEFIVTQQSEVNIDYTFNQDINKSNNLISKRYQSRFIHLNESSTVNPRSQKFSIQSVGNRDTSIMKTANDNTQENHEISTNLIVGDLNMNNKDSIQTEGGNSQQNILLSLKKLNS